jgi:type II secretory pathway pseudopilin PulG
MVFNPSTGVRTVKRFKSQLAFTLAEMLLAIGISSLIAIALATTLFFGARSMSALNNYVALNRAGRAALDQMTLDIRAAYAVSNYVGSLTNCSKVEMEGAGELPLTYEFNSTAKTLQRMANGTTNTLLTNCLGHFELFQSALITNSWNHYQSPASAADIKVVLVKWTCSRRMYGTLNNTNTEDQVTARILIRN